MGYQLFEFENLKDCHKALTERFKEFFNAALKNTIKFLSLFLGAVRPLVCCKN